MSPPLLRAASNNPPPDLALGGFCPVALVGDVAPPAPASPDAAAAMDSRAAGACLGCSNGAVRSDGSALDQGSGSKAPYTCSGGSGCPLLLRAVAWGGSPAEHKGSLFGFSTAAARARFMAAPGEVAAAAAAAAARAPHLAQLLGVPDTLPV